jgi:rfaE bifunctional protein nucleotidyltransferase chain/domain
LFSQAAAFDLFHEGHRHVLREAAKLGTHLVVGVNSDDSVRRLKGPERPVDSERRRARHVMAFCPCSTAVAIFDEDTPIELIKLFIPDVIVHADDNPDPKRVVGWQTGAQIVVIPRLPGISTTSIIANRNTA